MIASFTKTHEVRARHCPRSNGGQVTPFLRLSDPRSPVPARASAVWSCSLFRRLRPRVHAQLLAPQRPAWARL